MSRGSCRRQRTTRYCLLFNRCARAVVSCLVGIVEEAGMEKRGIGQSILQPYLRGTLVGCPFSVESTTEPPFQVAIKTLPRASRTTLLVAVKRSWYYAAQMASGMTLRHRLQPYTHALVVFGQTSRHQPVPLHLRMQDLLLGRTATLHLSRPRSIQV